MSGMTPSEYLKARNEYRYPAVGLTGSLDSWQPVDFHSTHQLDCHHNELLMSEEKERAVLGYLSTIFWGYYNSPDQAKRAHERAHLAFTGKDIVKGGKIQRRRGVIDCGIDFAADAIQAASVNVRMDQYSEALERLSHLPQLGIPFASKICTFLAPEKCGVIDRVIAGKYASFHFSVNDKGYVKPTSSNRDLYSSYCLFLQEQARMLNEAGEGLLWQDRDNVCHQWRAVDVERALYSAKSLRPVCRGGPLL